MHVGTQRAGFTPLIKSARFSRSILFIDPNRMHQTPTQCCQSGSFSPQLCGSMLHCAGKLGLGRWSEFLLAFLDFLIMLKRTISFNAALIAHSDHDAHVERTFSPGDFTSDDMRNHTRDYDSFVAAVDTHTGQTRSRWTSAAVQPPRQLLGSSDSEY